MLIAERFVDPSSESYFHTASELAKEIFFYPLCTGLFLCSPGYQISRGRYDSFLIFCVVKGQGYVYDGVREIPVHQGSFVFIDCYAPQRYGTRDGWEICWLHFDGVLARRYFEICTKCGPVILPDEIQPCFHNLQRIFEMFQARNRISEAEISRRITNLLTRLIQSAGQQSSQPKAADVIEETLVFISENISRPLTLEEMAKNVSLSSYYFSRLFKKKTGYTPHEYLIRSRVDRARYLLKSTAMPLKEIAFCCGFSNECSFSSTFRKVTGITPLSCRNETP